jgi:hypothetical protein
LSFRARQISSSLQTLRGRAARRRFVPRIPLRHGPVQGEIGVFVFSSPNAAREIAREAQGDGGEQDAAAGIPWWKAQSEAARNFWLDRVGPGSAGCLFRRQNPQMSNQLNQI